MIQKISQLIPSKGKNPTTAVEATPADVVQVGVAILPICGKGLDDADAQVRQASMEAILNSALALTDMLPSPDSRKVSGSSDRYRSTLGLGEEERADLLPLAKALGEQGQALARAQSDSDAQVRLLARKTLEEMATAVPLVSGRARGASPSAQEARAGDGTTILDSGPSFGSQEQASEANKKMLSSRVCVKPSRVW